MHTLQTRSWPLVSASGPLAKALQAKRNGISNLEESASMGHARVPAVLRVCASLVGSFPVCSFTHMWTLPQRLPWQTLQKGHRPDFNVLRHLEPEGRELVALSGTGWRSGRFSLVGSCAASTAIESAEHARFLFDAPPNSGLRVLALGYELGRRFVDLPQREAPGNQPLGIDVSLDSALVVDHQRNSWTVLGDRDAALHLALLGSAPDVPHRPPPNSARFYPASSDADHEANVRLAQAYIGLGDVYQANVTRQIRVNGLTTGVEAHIALSMQNPVAHGCYLRAQGIELISNSMETLLTFAPNSRRLSSFPIKGTRPRAGDRKHETDELRKDPKEQAEHVMIVDLVRNDLGRVCDVGSIAVPELMAVEGYRGVWHGVSRIEGRLRDDASLGDAVAALFPGGSITGAPKRRSVEVLERIEQEPRGFYTGSIGLLGTSGELSMSILIRTLIRDARGWSLGVGGGIVADSVPDNEVKEAQAKIRVFEEVLSGEPADCTEYSETGRLSPGSTLSL